MNKSHIWDILKGLLKKEAIKRILGAAAGGIKGILIGLIVGVILDKWIKPAYNWITRKIQMIPKKIKVKKAVKKLEEAIDETDFNDSYDDMP